MSKYAEQAAWFLADHGLAMRIALADSKPAPWEDEDKGARHHYRVTISRAGGGRLAFDFWGSIRDAQAGEHPHAYDVLACISYDAYTPDTFGDFCAEYGYSEDSIRALQTFRRADRFAKRLRAFFSRAELEKLAEIN